MLPALDTGTDLSGAVGLAAWNRRIALNMTQTELATRSGVPLGTLKWFERLGEVSLPSLLALAEALNARPAFHRLFAARIPQAGRVRTPGVVARPRAT
ncbi:helix-turn-helix domain-containing protein [Meridianimarinicoccus sp. RP-17]|uniref:helix-turn-helix domain-containing protein n=1 Tax=Meridianimarinicoccus zhengii TaxID=2056810 RepID=UPI001F1B5C2F|nr:helix-turn-helix transcriptional regulator [Phycocomes zhengii]